VYLGSHHITSCVDPLNWFTEDCYLSGLNEEQYGSRENYGGALIDINIDSAFLQRPLKIAELLLQVADLQHSISGRGYNGCVVRVECHVEMVRGRVHFVDTQTELYRGDESILMYPTPHVSRRFLVRLEGFFERPTPDVGLVFMDYVRGNLRPSACRGYHRSRP